MNINRHNYENFFLLYTDNELSAAERKAVDDFVEINPDLQKELLMLQQLILMPDDIIFEDKSTLLQNEFVPSELQERLLLHLDNELTSTEKNETDTLIKSNPDIKKEWEILQQAKLSAEVIVFKDKPSLYRKEPGRVIAFPWKRIAAAAVLIGFGLWGGLTYFNRDTKQADIASNNIKKIEGKKNSGSNADKPATNPTKAIVVPQEIKEQSASTVQSLVKTIAATKNDLAEKSAKSPKKTELRKMPKDDVRSDDVAQETNKPKDNNLPKPYFENVNNVDGNKKSSQSVVIQKQPGNIVNPGNDETVKKKSSDKNAANEFAATASFIDNSEDKSNNRVLFMDEEKIKKTKLGGIFRKVKRVFERNTNMKSGDNNIKVANLEFAIQ